MVQVHLQKFSGPLGLLLHLIREQEMNIFDIDISRITHQYLEYIRAMKNFDLEIAGDFVAMASTLLQIKSRMLLPQYNEQGEEVEAEDPRKELVNRLIEYQKYQDAAKRLGEKPWVNRDWWLRGERLQIESVSDGGIELEENPLFGLISAYRRALRGMKTGVHRVVAAMQSVAQRILEIQEHLVVGRRVEFSSLISADGDRRLGQVLMTFLSLLELGKMGFVRLFQSENFAEIHIETQRPIDGDVIQRVESYDNVTAAELAEKIMVESGRVEMVSAEAADGEVIPSELGLEGSQQLEFMEASEPQVQSEPLSVEIASDEEIEAEERRLFSVFDGGVEPEGGLV